MMYYAVIGPVLMGPRKQWCCVRMIVTLYSNVNIAYNNDGNAASK